MEELISRCVKEKKTLVATFTEEALKLADVVVVDVQCDYLKEDPWATSGTGAADMEALEESHGHDCRSTSRRGAGADRNHGGARYSPNRWPIRS